MKRFVSDELPVYFTAEKKKRITSKNTTHKAPVKKNCQSHSHIERNIKEKGGGGGGELIVFFFAISDKCFPILSLNLFY